MEKYWSNSDHSAGWPCILNDCTDIVQRRGVPGPAEILSVYLYQLYTMWNFRHGPAEEANTSSNTMARSWIPLQATPPPSTSQHSIHNRAGTPLTHGWGKNKKRIILLHVRRAGEWGANWANRRSTRSSSNKTDIFMWVAVFQFRIVESTKIESTRKKYAIQCPYKLP